MGGWIPSPQAPFPIVVSRVDVPDIRQLAEVGDFCPTQQVVFAPKIVVIL
jgi:hypothetical protein